MNEAVVVYGRAAEISGVGAMPWRWGEAIRAVKGAWIRGDAVAVAGGLILRRQRP